MMTCNFGRDNSENRKDDRQIVRIPPGQNIGTDTPAQRTVKHGAYLWVLTPRRRAGKSWRDISATN